MQSKMVYEVQDLASARLFLSTTGVAVIIINPSGSTRYYGMRVIDSIFNILKQEFPSQIIDIIINAGDDYAAFITAKELGYSNIITD